MTYPKRKALSSSYSSDLMKDVSSTTTSCTCTARVDGFASGSASDDTEDHGQPPGPTFTPEDEEREKHELTRAEVVSAEYDLMGIATDFSGLFVSQGGVGEIGADQQITRENEYLRQLEVELDAIPEAEKYSYLQAVTRCPGQVADRTRRLAFLERDAFDAKSAARRMIRYWEERLRIFGHDKAYRPMTLHGAMKDEVTYLLASLHSRLLPDRDDAGRLVVYGDPGAMNYDNLVLARELRVLWYLFETLCEDPASLRKGVVFVADVRNVQGGPGAFRINGSLTKARHSFINDIFPIKSATRHFCHPSAFAYYIVFPFIKFTVGRSGRQRLKEHYGAEEEVLQSLAQYGLPRTILPTKLGGEVKLDPDRRAWVHARLAQEYAASSTSSLSVSFDDATSDSRKTQPSTSEASITAQQGSNQETPQTEGMNSRLVTFIEERLDHRSDERMNRAIMAKVRDPTMSNYEAIIEGGFTYPNPERGTASQDVYDSDSISLHQRKNQLSRRLRQLKSKYIEECNNNDTGVDAAAEMGTEQSRLMTDQGQASKRQKVDDA